MLFSSPSPCLSPDLHMYLCHDTFIQYLIFNTSMLCLCSSFGIQIGHWMPISLVFFTFIMSMFPDSIDDPSIGRQGCNSSFTSDLRQHGLSRLILPHQQHLTAFSPSLSSLSPSELPITHEQINIQMSGYAPQHQNNTYSGDFPNQIQNNIKPGLDSFEL